MLPDLHTDFTKGRSCGHGKKLIIEKKILFHALAYKLNCCQNCDLWNCQLLVSNWILPLSFFIEPAQELMPVSEKGQTVLLCNMSFTYFLINYNMFKMSAAEKTCFFFLFFLLVMYCEIYKMEFIWNKFILWWVK